MDIKQYVGNRIRQYRKNRNLTLLQLSERIHKSRSILSKYETGDVAIDIETLQDIARELNTPIEQLVNVPGQTQLQDYTSMNGFFLESSLYYLYYSDGKNICECAMEFKPSAESGFRAVLYSRIEEDEGPDRWKYPYSGKVQNIGSYTTFLLESSSNYSDQLYMIVLNPFNTTNRSYGMMMTVLERLHMPVAFRFMITTARQKRTPELLRALTLSKTALTDIKRHNMLVLSNEE